MSVIAFIVGMGLACGLGRSLKILLWCFRVLTWKPPRKASHADAQK